MSIFHYIFTIFLSLKEDEEEARVRECKILAPIKLDIKLQFIFLPYSVRRDRELSIAEV